MKHRKITNSLIEQLRHHLVPLYGKHDEAISEQFATLPTTYQSAFQRTHGVTVVIHTDQQITDQVSDQIQDDLFDQIKLLAPQPQRGIFLLRVRVTESEQGHHQAMYSPWLSQSRLYPADVNDRMQDYFGQPIRAGMVIVPRDTVTEGERMGLRRALRHELWHAIDDIYKQTPEMQAPPPDANGYDPLERCERLMGDELDRMGVEPWLDSGITESVMRGFSEYLSYAPEDFVHQQMARQYGVEPYTATAYQISHSMHSNIAISGIDLLHNICRWGRHERGQRVPPKYFRRFAEVVKRSIDPSTGFRAELLSELKQQPAYIGKYFR